MTIWPHQLADDVRTWVRGVLRLPPKASLDIETWAYVGDRVLTVVGWYTHEPGVSAPVKFSFGVQRESH